MTTDHADQQGLFKLLAEESIDGIAIATPDGLLTYANRSFKAMSGFGEGAIGSHITDYHAPENLPKVQSEILTPLTTTGRWQGEVEHVRPDGTTWLAQLSAVMLRNEQGEATAIGTIFRDVTEQRAREREVIEANHRIEQSFLTSPLATLEADNQGNIMRWNPAAEHIFGWTAEEALGKNALELLVPNLAREHVEAIIAALLRGEATNSRNDNITKDGRIITCQWHNAVIRNSDGVVLGWLSQTQDVTEQLRTLEAVRSSEARAKALLEAVPDLMLVFNADGIYLDYKAERDDDLAAPPEVLLGKSLYDVVAPELADQVYQLIQTTLQTRQSQPFEYQIELNNGQRFFEARMVPSGDDQVMMLARDITERMRAERERNQFQEQIIAAQQAALRELGTPIVPISDGVVAMPLIGAIDSMRAQQVIETLLEGVSTSHASIAILDITGVQVVDTQVANTLLRAAQAVRLLGTRVILTGIRPEVAQTLVGLGLDLSGITTLASLQSGISYALRKV
jgi:rsbT co-antagonist protein RsbR